LGLRLIKELLPAASYSSFILTEMLILPWLAEIARFQHTLPLEERVRLLFAQQSKEPSQSADILQLGKSIFQISTEIIMGFASWVVDAPYQNQSFPTLFQVEFKRLKEEGVQFPPRLSFLKEEERMELVACYQSKLQFRH